MVSSAKISHSQRIFRSGFIFTDVETHPGCKIIADFILIVALLDHEPRFALRACPIGILASWPNYW
jgi:hypothetical protein